MTVGEFISENIGELFTREQRIRTDYIKFCMEHDKILETRYLISANSLFILEIIILNKNGNNGEIKSS
jgi:hypothetical protein